MIKLDYGTERLNEILENKEQIEQIEKSEYLENKLRSKKVAKLYKNWLNIYQKDYITE